jgi:hypothetical protein
MSFRKRPEEGMRCGAVRRRIAKAAMTTVPLHLKELQHHRLYT